MRYSLRTLMMVAGVAPPAIAFAWFFWKPLLFLAICTGLIALWVFVGLAICRFIAGLLVSSVMG
jgi:hypothetical protein